MRETRRWLFEEVAPAAARGERLVVAWRWDSWNLTKAEKDGATILFNTAPVSSRWPAALAGRVEAFLDGR